MNNQGELYKFEDGTALLRRLSSTIGDNAGKSRLILFVVDITVHSSVVGTRALLPWERNV
jgi:hypothetical protein